MRVMKFGGTSVGTPQRMKEVARLIHRPERIIVVLSAVTKTTDRLFTIAGHFSRGERETAEEVIAALRSEYHRFVEGLFSTEAGKNSGRSIIDTHFDLIAQSGQNSFTDTQRRIIVAQGEIISSTLFHQYLQESGVKAVLLNALDFMRLDDDGEPDQEYISENLSAILNQHPDTPLFITQGYICRNAFGEIDNLKRGGSDHSASLIGAATGCEEIQIWTDIDGMQNNDPRYVQNTVSIRQLSFEEAAELAYFGAKILHPFTILPARQFNIPVRLLNTMKPEAPGTLISSEQGEGEIKAVAAKDGITAIKIKSSRMLLAYGFLRKVFEVFERYRTPIDMITTSEVAVSLTIDNPAHLEEIVDELEEFGNVSVDADLTIICVVGDFVAESKGVALRVFESLRDIPLRMISYGGSLHNISLLIRSDLKVEALNALHRGLFDAHA